MHTRRAAPRSATRTDIVAMLPSCRVVGVCLLALPPEIELVSFRFVRECDSGDCGHLGPGCGQLTLGNRRHLFSHLISSLDSTLRSRVVCIEEDLPRV